VDRVRGGVDVVQAQVADLLARDAVQEGEDPEEGFVRVGVGLAGPPAEQGALLVAGDGGTVEAAGLSHGQAAGRVGEDDPVGAGGAEELAEHREVAFAVVRRPCEECFDVVDVGQGPVVLAAVVGEEAGEVGHGGQGGLDGVVGAGPGPGPAGPVPGPEHRVLVVGYRAAQRFGRCLHAAPTTVCGQTLGLVGRHREGTFDEEVLKGAGQRTHRAARTAGAFQQRMRVSRATVAQQPTQGGDHGAGSAHAVSGGQVRDEVRQPRWWSVQAGGEVVGLNERPVGVGLPAP
jgi:hypothetical protein